MYHLKDWLLLVNEEGDAATKREELLQACRRIHNQGQFFLAFDLAMHCNKQFPDDIQFIQVAASSLIQTGAYDDAHSLLSPYTSNLDDKETNYESIFHDLHTIMSQDSFSKDVEAIFERLISRSDIEIRSAHNRTMLSEETIGLLGRLYKEIWKQKPSVENAKRCRLAYKFGYEHSQGYWTLVNTASMTWILGYKYGIESDKRLAKEYAKKVIQITAPLMDNSNYDEKYWLFASQGEAHLLLGNGKKASQLYQKAVSFCGKNFHFKVSSRRQLLILKSNGCEVPKSIFDTLKPPVVLSFSGHMIDSADRKSPRFPDNPDFEGALRIKIDHYLEKVGASVGYSSAAAGADIIFVEAMIDRGAEVHIIIPFEEDDFIKSSVAFAGERWVIRFKKVLKLADSVSFITDEQYLNDDILFGFFSKVCQGNAYLKAAALETKPHMLAVWDEFSSNLVGGTSDSVLEWPDKSTLHVINVNELHSLMKEPPPVDSCHSPNDTVVVNNQSSPKHGSCLGKRVIRTMLFADVTGFSKLEEECIPDYIHLFLREIAESLKDWSEQLHLINTWGDAIYTVMDDALSMAGYADALLNAVTNTDWREVGLSRDLGIRIALHAGPIFQGLDPLTGRTNFYGSHVSRTARLEPVTVPNHIYATEQFAALLMQEMVQKNRKDDQDITGMNLQYSITYVGLLSLAKKYGDQRVYQIRKQNE